MNTFWFQRENWVHSVVKSFCRLWVKGEKGENLVLQKSTYFENVVYIQVQDVTKNFLHLNEPSFIFSPKRLRTFARLNKILHD
jgi:hypothetical protein